jgi:hypothetical protein
MLTIGSRCNSFPNFCLLLSPTGAAAACSAPVGASGGSAAAASTRAGPHRALHTPGCVLLGRMDAHETFCMGPAGGKRKACAGKRVLYVCKDDEEEDPTIWS